MLRIRKKSLLMLVVILLVSFSIGVVAYGEEQERPASMIIGNDISIYHNGVLEETKGYLCISYGIVLDVSDFMKMMGWEKVETEEIPTFINNMGDVISFNYETKTMYVNQEKHYDLTGGIFEHSTSSGEKILISMKTMAKVFDFDNIRLDNEYYFGKNFPDYVLVDDEIRALDYYLDTELKREIEDSPSLKRINIDYKPQNNDVKVSFNFNNKEGEALVDEDGFIDKSKFESFSETIEIEAIIKYGEVEKTKSYQYEIYKEAIINGRDYGWYFSQHGTGTYSQDNCGPASVAMALKWIDENHKYTPEIIRDQFGYSGGTYLRDQVEFVKERGVDIKPKRIISRKNAVEMFGNESIYMAVVRSREFYENGADPDLLHTLIVYGYYGNSPDNSYLIIKDPWSDMKEVSFEHFTNSLYTGYEISK